MRTHVTVVGILHIVYSLVLYVFAGFLVVMVSGGVGALLAFVEDVPLIGALTASGFGVLVGSFLILLGLPGLLGGIGIMKFQPWGRIVILIISVLDLLSCPFGTALGIYSLWVLLQEESAALFENRTDYRYQSP